MNEVLRRLLLLPVMAPLAAVLALALLNPRPAVALRVLTWTSPALPIGSWLAVAVAGGGLLSAAATAAALQGGGGGRRTVRMGRVPMGTVPMGTVPMGTGRPGQERSAPGPRATAGPPRPPGAPPPTVEVPFRVIRRGGGNDTASPEVTATGDGWDATPDDQW
jgi:hypothetical protein